MCERGQLRLNPLTLLCLIHRAPLEIVLDNSWVWNMIGYVEVYMWHFITCNPKIKQRKKYCLNIPSE